jgi:hypothetical protein
MTATASQFGVWSNRAQPSYGTSSASANLRQSNTDGRFPVPVWGRVVDRSRTWQDFLGSQQDFVTVPAQEFDTTAPVATFAALDFTTDTQANFDVTPPVATFSALAPTFEAQANFDVTAPVATFSALDFTLDAQANFDVTPPVATFSALDYTLDAQANFDTTAPVATFSALDYTLDAQTDFDVAPPVATFSALDVLFETATGPQLFDTTAPVATFSALDVVFAQPAPGPTPRVTVKVGGGGMTGEQFRRLRAEQLAKQLTPEEIQARLCETLERLDKRLEYLEECQPSHRNRNVFLGIAGSLFLSVLKRRVE